MFGFPQFVAGASMIWSLISDLWFALAFPLGILLGLHLRSFNDSPDQLSDRQRHVAAGRR